MKTGDFTFELISKGCYIKRNGSNHDILYSPITKRKFQIPRHKSQELGRGLEMKARKALGV